MPTVLDGGICFGPFWPHKKSVFGGVSSLAWYRVTCVLESSLFNNWFMVSVRLLSYGCTREVAKHERSVARQKTDLQRFILLAPSQY